MTARPNGYVPGGMLDEALGLYNEAAEERPVNSLAMGSDVMAPMENGETVFAADHTSEQRHFVRRGHREAPAT